MGSNRRGRASALVASGLAVLMLAGPAAAVDPPAADPVGAADPALVSLSILPPGNGNFAGPTSWSGDDQRTMYDHLDDPVARGNLTDADLPRFFKDARMGAGRIVRTQQPRQGVRIEWDSFAVPHVYGETETDVAFGAGYAVADARMLLAELARILGRAGAIEMGGPDLFSALGSLGSTPQLNYTDEELQASIDEVIAADPVEGAKVLAALDAFVAGINTWLERNTFPKELQDLGLKWRPWTRTDALAVGITVDDVFGAGGGDEVGNAVALGQLIEQLGWEGGFATYTDLKMTHAPEATTHVAEAFPYPQFAASPDAAPSPQNTVDPASIALPDEAAIEWKPGLERHIEPPKASNYVAITGERSATGHPVLVGGPQSAYILPQLLFEMELQGGGYDVRGITFPGIGPWVVIGRSRSYAWTATAGGSDLTDQRAEKLCEPDGSAPTTASMHYEFDGECRAMTKPDASPTTVERTVHGPVVGRGLANGVPVAFVRERFSRLKTAWAAKAFRTLDLGGVTEAADFAEVMSDIPMSFNWVYVNQHDIAYFHSGWYPIRKTGVPYDLPTWGTGEWEFQGRLDWRHQPQGINPNDGYLVSWNNRVAPEWSDPDNAWGRGDVQRVDLLRTRAEQLPAKATVADVVALTQDAGTADLRGQLVIGEVLAILEGTRAPSAQVEKVRQLLTTWSRNGAHRRDTNHDWFYDDPAVPVIDELWPRVLAAVFEPGLGDYFRDDDVRRPNKFDDAPSQIGSAFQDGWYSLLQRDLRRVQGIEAVPAEGTVYCGGGELATCREVLWQALRLATWHAEQHQFFWNRGNPAQWSTWTFPERIRFLPYIFNTESMRWVNRPTFQQVVSFGDPGS